MIRYLLTDTQGLVVATGAHDADMGLYYTTPDPAFGIPTTHVRTTPGGAIDAVLASCEEIEIHELRWVWDE